MKIGLPKVILVADTCIGNPTYTEYKFNGKVYKGCYEYIHFWINGEGKWKCFKKYLEVGNDIYSAWFDYKVNGIVSSVFKFKEW